ncbi:MAG: hypothetical protein P8I42_01700 [Flavobacteriaceae bacterium]|nr:hypothetical protein [Flavobacteriaceae bacterium]MDG1911521.1 hypothetical protein [Flavobacteriaceae bacterium]
MNSKKNIFPFFIRLLSVGLVMVFLLPLGLKLIHSFEFHSNPKTCKNNKTHIHESNTHNDALDYFFQPLVHEVEDVFEAHVFFLLTEEKSRYNPSFKSVTYKRYRSRAPPALFI